MFIKLAANFVCLAFSARQIAYRGILKAFFAENSGWHLETTLVRAVRVNQNSRQVVGEHKQTKMSRKTFKSSIEPRGTAESGDNLSV